MQPCYSCLSDLLAPVSLTFMQGNQMFASFSVSVGGRSAPLVSGRTSFDRHFSVLWSAMLFAAWTTSAQPILPPGQHLCSPEFNKTEVMESTSPPCVNVLVYWVTGI